MRPFKAFTTWTLLGSPTLTTSLPACSTNSKTPCGCPGGTSYQESVTFATIGAKATDVRALIGSFFQPTWFGGLPFTTQGRDGHPDALRTFEVPTPEGARNYTEKLTQFYFKPSGSFIQKFELLPSSFPLQFGSANGSLSGFWVTLQSSSIFKYETAITWSVYACAIEHPLDYALLHESGLANATRVLQEQGKVLGVNLKPISIQSF